MSPFGGHGCTPCTQCPSRSPRSRNLNIAFAPSVAAFARSRSIHENACRGNALRQVALAWFGDLRVIRSARFNGIGRCRRPDRGNRIPEWPSSGLRRLHKSRGRVARCRWGVHERSANKGRRSDGEQEPGKTQQRPAVTLVSKRSHAHLSLIRVMLLLALDGVDLNSSSRRIDAAWRDSPRVRFNAVTT